MFSASLHIPVWPFQCRFLPTATMYTTRLNLASSSARNAAVLLRTQPWTMSVDTHSHWTWPHATCSQQLRNPASRGRLQKDLTHSAQSASCSHVSRFPIHLVWTCGSRWMENSARTVTQRTWSSQCPSCWPTSARSWLSSLETWSWLAHQRVLVQSSRARRLQLAWMDWSKWSSLYNWGHKLNTISGALQDFLQYIHTQTRIFFFIIHFLVINEIIPLSYNTKC